jgi:hypothetical protein
MHKKNKESNKNIVPKQNNPESWDDLISLAEKHVLWADVRKEEIQAAISVYRYKKDAGVIFPGVEAAQESATNF